MVIHDQPFEFGIYPGGAAGTDTGLTTGPEDKLEGIVDALNALQGKASSFLVRAYVGYRGRETTTFYTPAQPEQLLSNNRKLDLVLCFQSAEMDMTGWKQFIARQIDRFGNRIRFLQITEEANVKLPSLDGFFEGSRKALVEGVVHAKAYIRDLGLPIQVGFNATPDFNPQRTFWKEIGSLAASDFHNALDYVGLDFFPGVFRPLPANDKATLENAITMVLKVFKEDIATAGIDASIPLHITENGWPTTSDKSEEDQSQMLNTIVSALFKLRGTFNIQTYEMFSLRDADTSVDNLYYRFGIMRDNYTKKKAFEMFGDLVRQFTVA